MYEIIKGRPVADRQANNQRGPYPFGTMEVGDCIEVPEAERTRATSAYCYHKAKYGKEFTSMKLPNGMIEYRRTK